MSKMRPSKNETPLIEYTVYRVIYVRIEYLSNGEREDQTSRGWFELLVYITCFYLNFWELAIDV